MCEIYKCSGCDVKVKTVSEIRSHIRNDHDNSSFEHIQMNRNKNNKVWEKHCFYDSIEED